MVTGFLPPVVSLFHLHVMISGARGGMTSDNMTQASSKMFLVMGQSGLGAGVGPQMVYSARILCLWVRH